MIDLRKSLIEQRVSQNAEGCVKTVNDLARYRHVLDAYRPTMIIETGTFSGKSARWFSQWCPVISIDNDHRNLDPLIRDAVRTPAKPFNHVDFVMGDSTNARVVATVYDMVGDPDRHRIFVVLDSDHSGLHVMKELTLYSSLVSVGSYIVVEDTIVRWCPWEQIPEGPYVGSPLDAVELFMQSQVDMAAEMGDVAGSAGPVFEIDYEIEDMFKTTQFPCGWLRRTS